MNDLLVEVYAGGYATTNSVQVTNLGENNYSAVVEVDNSDYLGEVSFQISSSNLDQIYSETTDSSRVIIEALPTPTPTQTPTPTPTPTLTSTPTPTSTPAATSSTTDGVSLTSSSDSSQSHTSFCHQLAPVQIPDLYQVEIMGTQATVYFAPLTNLISNYYLAYSELPGVDQHGVFTNQSVASGALSFTVRYLKPYTVYYFRVRPFNECQPGNYSSEIRVITNQPGSKIITRFYRGSIRGLSVITQPASTGFTNPNQVIPTKNNSQPSLDHKLPDLSPTPAPVAENRSPTATPDSSSQANINQEPTFIKKCFLWWCWNSKR